MSKRKYPDNFYDAFKTLGASKVLIVSLYEELKTTRQSLVISQNELENWKNKYHKSDKRVSVLDERISSSVATEIIKFLVSTILAGIGINLVTDGNVFIGGLFIVGSIISYIIIVKLGKKK